MRKRKINSIALLIALLSVLGCGKEEDFVEQLLLPGESGADLDRPRVVFLGPASGATNVQLNSQIVITFSKAMDPVVTQNALILEASGGSVQTDPFWLSDRSVSFTVSPSLTAAKRYSVRVAANLARDMQGNYLAVDYLSHFYTVGAGTAPQVTSSSPGTLSAIEFGWPVDQDPVVNFSVPMDPLTAGDAVTISGGPARFIRQWSNGNRTLTLNLQDPLEGNVTYTLKVASGANSADGIALTSPRTYLFHTGTDTVPPDLASVTTGTYVWPGLQPYPTLNQVTGVSKNSWIVFDFTEAMDPSSTIEAISFDPPISGQFSWLTPAQLQFQPDNRLETDETYRLIIESSATDVQGLPLPNRYLADFVVSDPLDSAPITLVEVRGFTAGPPDAADATFGSGGTITGIPDSATEYSLSRNSTNGCNSAGEYQYRLDLVFQTAGGEALKLAGSGNVFDSISVRYFSGHPRTTDAIFERIDYSPSAGLQIVRLRTTCLTLGIRSLISIQGGNAGLQDINDNTLSDDIDFVIYPVN